MVLAVFGGGGGEEDVISTEGDRSLWEDLTEVFTSRGVGVEVRNGLLGVGETERLRPRMGVVLLSGVEAEAVELTA